MVIFNDFGNDYSYESIVYEEVMGEQIYRIEFDMTGITYTGDGNSIIPVREWNVVQAVYNKDQDFYNVDDSKITGLSPMKTYGCALRGLEECFRYFIDNYKKFSIDLEEDDNVVIDTFYAGAADERRKNVYEKVLRKKNWIESEYDGDWCMKKSFESVRVGDNIYTKEMDIA